MNSFECGAACLTMILRYFGRETRLEECRARCDPGRNGVTARTIVAAAARFGLEARAYAMTAHNFDAVALPCIIHWNRDHFVVLERWSANGASIVDPDRGRRTVPLDEFAQLFGDVVLQFQPGPGFDRESEPGQNPVWTYLREMLHVPGTARILATIIGASLLLQVFGFAVPLLTREIVDRVLPTGRNAPVLNVMLAGSAMAAAMHALTVYARAHLLLRLQTRLDSHLMLTFFRHLLSLPFRFFQLRNTGDLLMRLSSNATIRDALTGYTTSAILDGSLVVVFLLALMRISPVIGTAAVIIAVAEVVVLLITFHRLQSLVESDIACQSSSQSCLVESLMGIGTLKAAGAEKETLSRWSGLLSRQLDSSWQRGRYSAKVEAAMTAIRTFSPLFLLWLGAALVLDGSMSLGTMLAVNGLAAVFLQPVTSLVQTAQRVQLASVHLERISDVMRTAPEQDTSINRVVSGLTGKIELRHVSFRYDAQSPYVLRDISLAIEAGQKIALVGRTGSGKSTLAKLLLGLYMVTEGEIEYDGVPIQSMNLETLRRQWGTALQDSFLFSSSLRENITFCHPGISQARMVQAANISEIHADIMAMPMAYETRIDEAGQSLSGGQRQRLAIARAVAGNPPLILLDEATSHLDAVTEAAVDRNLDTLSCTRVIVAHRLSTIRNADLIVVLEDGCIAERGTHDQLLRRDSIYAALVRNQMRHSGERSAARAI
jgi:ABC-type bacteriocin/lantibiotic exporter with double-glycine peptidase domain